MKKEALSLLYGYTDNQWREICRIYEEAKRVEPESEEKVVYLGYFLHNLYCAFEDLFKEVARIFENQVLDPSLYHRELLKRMCFDIPGIRPGLLSEESYKVLDELRRFRHTFRHAYTYKLDPERVKALRKKVIEAWCKVESDVLSFQNYLKSKFQEEG
jgi:uncharacterized protein YutE (UPF0331/DUF86 family)